MSLTNFVPEIWARELNFALRKRLVGLAMTNQDYEGEVRQQGDTVHITRPASINVGAYTPGSDITVQTPTSSQLDLVIDQADYFAFEVDDVRRVQANVDLMGPYTDEATYALSDSIDQYIFGLYTDADASNVIAKEALSAANIYDKLVAAGENLDANNVPEEGRWVILSPAEVALLRTSDYFTKATEMGEDTIRRGVVGEAAGLMVFKSNNVTEANDGTHDVRHLPYGHSIAITFAQQFANVESQRMEKRFSDLVKGLVLYGSKVIRPKALGDLRNQLP